MIVIASNQQAAKILENVFLIFESAQNFPNEGGRALREVPVEMKTITTVNAWMGDQAGLIAEMLNEISTITYIAKHMYFPANANVERLRQKIALANPPLPKTVKATNYYLEIMYLWGQWIHKCDHTRKTHKLRGNFVSVGWKSFYVNLHTAVSHYDQLCGPFGPHRPLAPAPMLFSAKPKPLGYVEQYNGPKIDPKIPTPDDLF